MQRTILLFILGLQIGACLSAQTISHQHLAAGGLSRTYTLRLPTGFDRHQTYPLLLLLHGRFGTGDNFMEYTEIGKIADQGHVIVVAPDGYKKSWNDGRGDTPAHAQGIDDIAFLSALIAETIGSQPIDTSRIYCCGMSNGGFMTLALASKMGDRLAAIAVVTASIPSIDPASHLPIGQVPLLIMNGTEDPLVKYKGGPISRRNTETVMATPDFAAAYAQRLQCGVVETSGIGDPQADGTKVEVTTWDTVDQLGILQLWTIQGGGHTWPGKRQYLSEKIVGKTCRDIDGTQVIWNFLQPFHR